MIHPDLTKLDTRKIPTNANEIRLFGVAYNESLRIPYLIEHYRKLGVNRFFFISNNSTDTTNDYILSQSDCHLFHTTANYIKARAGLTWLNSLLDEYGTGHWIVLTDMDELLVYPACETKDLHALGRWMDEKGYQGLFTTMLDMYSDKPLADVNYQKGSSFVENCPYFDSNYWYVKRMGLPYLYEPFPEKEVIGGPRTRLCFPNQYTPAIWPRLRPKLLAAVQKFGLLNSTNVEPPAPQAFKIPLVKWQQGYAFITSHRLNPIHLAPMTGALLHFKYFQDFGGRVKEAVEKGIHYNGSAEYKKYAEILTVDQNFTMHDKNSARYENSNSLIKHGLMVDDMDFSEQEPLIAPNVIRLDKRPIPDDKSEIRAFAVAYNENMRIPYLLQYYRDMGVKRFFFISNASNDGSNEYLLEQPDCHVFYTEASFSKARAGLAWLNPLINKYGTGHWIMQPDADELLVYPGSETRKLPELCAWLDKHNYDGIFTLLLDIYSDQPLDKVNYQRGENFLNKCQYFDKTYWFFPSPNLPFLEPASPKMEVIGGPRHRLCFPNQYTPRLWPRLRPKLIRRGLRQFHRFGLFKNLKGEATCPAAVKVPLVKWKPGYAYLTRHHMTPIRLAPVTGALLHFKYFQDFAQRVARAIQTGAYYDGSSEYKRYAEILSKDPHFSMHNHGSAKYENSNSLLNAGLIKTTPEWSKS